MLARSLFIFDLDGTLANIDHRLPILEDKKDPSRYTKFFLACDGDVPIKATIKIFNLLYRQGDELLIWTGRGDVAREKTIEWLAKYTDMKNPQEIDGALLMRPKKSTTKDTLLKKSWLEVMPDDMRARLVAVFEDKPSVVDMFRAQGVSCFQVGDKAIKW